MCTGCTGVPKIQIHGSYSNLIQFPDRPQILDQIPTILKPPSQDVPQPRQTEEWSQDVTGGPWFLVDKLIYTLANFWWIHHDVYLYYCYTTVRWGLWTKLQLYTTVGRPFQEGELVLQTSPPSAVDLWWTNIYSWIRIERSLPAMNLEMKKTCAPSKGLSDFCLQVSKKGHEIIATLQLSKRMLAE